MDVMQKPASEDDERKLKNLATRIMSNGVEVLVKDKSLDRNPEQRRNKLIHLSSKSRHHHLISSPPKSLIASAIATVVNHQHMSAMFPLHQLMQRNYIIKTCLTTYTYLTTIIQNKRSTVSTFETIVSVVTTESLKNLYASDLVADIKPTKTKYVDVKTINPSIPNSKIFSSNSVPKIDKRIDNESESNSDGNFELIQPSEVGHTPCSSSCSCSHTQTESLNKLSTKFTKLKYKNEHTVSLPINKINSNIKTSKYENTKLEQVKPTTLQSLDQDTQYPSYQYDGNTKLAPTDKIVEKYTEVVNEYSEEKVPASVEETELLTNEQAPIKKDKVGHNKNPVLVKPEKPNKTNKNKVVADLIKLGSLGIKGLSQLAPVIEKMTGGLIKRHDKNKTSTTTTIKPATKKTPYKVHKRVDNELELKHNNFPIYIPVDELETAESQIFFNNATLHQNLAWITEHKHPKAHIAPPKIVHESALVNGGIPISPGEIITTNSDVIIGKPAVGGPLSLAASRIKIHNAANWPNYDNYVSSSEQLLIKENPSKIESEHTKIDDSYDLRPPELPKLKQKLPNRNLPRPNLSTIKNQAIQQPYHQNAMVSSSIKNKLRPQLSLNDHALKIEKVKTGNSVLGNHGRPAFLDYIPSLKKANDDLNSINKESLISNQNKEEVLVLDSHPSSSEIINTRIRNDEDYSMSSQQFKDSIGKPFLVDIQPSRVANVLIPHGSSTALIFAGSSEPHKTGDYIDDPLPYPEPGYFGSFSIDAPQMTNVHNVGMNNKNQPSTESVNLPSLQDSYRPVLLQNEQVGLSSSDKINWKDNKYKNTNKFPPPTSNQATHIQIGPTITSYNPDVYNPGIVDFDNINIRNTGTTNFKKVIDKEYENFLSVPPPPPKAHMSHDFHEDRTKPYNNRPMVHSKPIQDMKVFLNIQHPVPQSPAQMPSKVTSEVYFAAQASPTDKKTPVYTVHIPPGSTNSNNNEYYNHHPNNFDKGNKDSSTQVSVAMHKVHNKQPMPISSSSYTVPINENDKDKQNMYSVTLNAATNVANDAVNVIGSSSPVSLGTSTNYFEGVHGAVPIQANFAIKVEGPQATSNIINEQKKLHNEYGQPVHHFPHNDNRWNATNNPPSTNSDQTSISIESNNYNLQVNEHQTKYPQKQDNEIFLIPSINSHANFPTINDISSSSPSENKAKPVTELVNGEIKTDQKRPAKLIPNIPTNSHGWYSSIPAMDINLNNYANVNNINIEATTRKVIPLLHHYNHQTVPEFGQKISTAGRPPSEMWSLNNVPALQQPSKPFTKSEGSEIVNKKVTKPNTSVTLKPNEFNYLPSNFDHIQQPVYDIPTKLHNNEITTVKTTKSPKQDVKPVYETAEEIYDGEEENESGADGEVSLESMKVPIFSSAVKTHKTKPELTLLQEEVLESVPQDNSQVNNESKLIEFNPGSQTEKPFPNKFNNTGFQTNAINPINYNYTVIKPRPFTVNAFNKFDHQLHQPHWHINQLLENTTNISNEDSIGLNIGEEVYSKTTEKSSKNSNLNKPLITNKSKPPRPVFSVRPNNTFIMNDSNIITSNVHIQDKMPLTVIDDVDEESNLPTFTTELMRFDINRSSSEIIDLSPPPPTMNYNLKATNKDETIMGMSPPPPRSPLMPPIKPQMPVRTLPQRPILPPRTPPPYRSKPMRTLPPRVSNLRPSSRKPTREHQDDISTYRPSYDAVPNNHKQFNYDQPSAQLLPPPTNIPAGIIPSVNKVSPQEVMSPSLMPTVVFPTRLSSGWQTSSRVNFEPAPILFPETETASELPKPAPEIEENVQNYDLSLDSRYSDDTNNSEKEKNGQNKQKTENTSTTTVTSAETVAQDHEQNESQSNEDTITTTDRMKVNPLRNKIRTRKPYPLREEVKKSSTSKYKVPTKPSPVIRPTRTLLRPEILRPTKQSTIKNIHLIPTRKPSIHRPGIIESSESSIDDDYIKPTEVLKESEIATLSKSVNTKISDTSGDKIIHDNPEIVQTMKPTHHAGNEVKVYDDTVPIKTEFKTTVITLTKTLSEPPKTVSSIDYVNLTHTLTVTHTKTSLISQAGGQITQTLVLTNTHTSTIVDIVTKVQTHILPTTIIETVTKHIPVPRVKPTPVLIEAGKTKLALDDVTMSSEEENVVIKVSETTENVQKVEKEDDNDTFFVVMNKSQNGGQAPSGNTEVETPDYEGVIRNEQVNSNGVSQVLFGEILLAGTPYLETTNVHHAGSGFGKECQPDCKASRNERCQRIDGMMKCICRPGFARMFPDRPCKPTYTYSVKLALNSQDKERLVFQDSLANNNSKEYNALALATHEGINRMIMQSDLRDVYHGVHITGFQPIQMKNEKDEGYHGVMNDFYVQLSDNAHESRLKEVIEKYLRNNNYSLGGTDVYAASELVDQLDVSDFDECFSAQFHDCSEHAQCFNLRGTYTCSCFEGFADLSVNPLYPGRICSAEPVGCEHCNYHGSCYSRDDQRVLCECFQWYAGNTCHINLKVVLISLVTVGALLTAVLVACAVIACSRRPRRPRSIVACIQNMPTLHQGVVPSKRADRRALISDRADSGDGSSLQNASLPYMPSKKSSAISSSKKCIVMSEPPAHEAPPPPAPAVMIPRARFHPTHRDSRDNISRKQSLELSSEAKLISYLEAGANDEMMRRKHSEGSSYSLSKERHPKQGALVSAGFKVSTTIRPDEPTARELMDDSSSVHKADLEAELSRYDAMRKSYSQEDISEWTDAERRIGELTLSEARSVGGTLPASTGRAASSTRLTHQEANTMAERDLGSTFLLPHVHLYKPDITSDVSEFDSL